MDEIGVEIGISLGIILVSFREFLQPLPLLVTHSAEGVLLLFGKTVGMTAFLQLVDILLNLPILLSLFFRLLAHLLFRKEEAVKHPIKNQLLFPGFGVDGAQGGFDLQPIFKAKGNENLGGVTCFLGTDGQTFQLQHAGKGGEFFQVYARLSHDGVLRSDRRSCSRGYGRGAGRFLPAPSGLRCF